MHEGPGSGGGGPEGSSSYTLFIGQVRFETTPAELLWMIRRVSGAYVCHFESRGAGCYIIHCRSETDLQLIRGIHKRVLFDIGGVWLARTAEEIDALCEYVSLDAAVLSRKAHLPRDSMVVEERKADLSTLSATRYSSIKMENQPQVFMQYSTALLPQGQDLPVMYSSYPSYSTPYTSMYRPFISQVPMPNQPGLPPPPPYGS
ncbi:unnamed protein product [Phytomonas sp. Hart1]|nr:unnamed protein product [Phytomonas sp. Hart1]|eukprot:CCW71112.1 unnamed protein product [Phytomonas sp. isolate Hart1]